MREGFCFHWSFIFLIAVRTIGYILIIRLNCCTHCRSGIIIWLIRIRSVWKIASQPASQKGPQRANGTSHVALKLVECKYKSPPWYAHEQCSKPLLVDDNYNYSGFYCPAYIWDYNCNNNPIGGSLTNQYLICINCHDLTVLPHWMVRSRGDDPLLWPKHSGEWNIILYPDPMVITIIVCMVMGTIEYYDIIIPEFHNYSCHEILE